MRSLSPDLLSRQDTPEPERRPHILVVGEAQCFLHGIDFPSILSEARKYRLVLTLATQTMNQLPEKSLASIFGNCATIVSFRVSGEDAQTLKREFATLMPGSELQDLPDFKFYLRTLSQGQTSGPHLINALPPLQGTGMENKRERVIRTSLERFGRTRKEVEDRINRFLRPIWQTLRLLDFWRSTHPNLLSPIP